MIKYLLNPTRMYFILIIITCCHFAFYAHELPIHYFDELLYFLFGRTSPNVDWSPLYSVYYSVLNYFIEDNLFLYRTNHFLIASLLFPTAIYALTFRMFLSPSVAALTSLFFYLTNINLIIGPYVHIFNFSVISLFVLCLIKIFPGRLYLLIFYVLGLALHLRTENFIMTSCYVLFVTFCTFKNENFKKGLLVFGMSVLFTLSGFLTLNWSGTRPIAHDSKRTIQAFQDHYVWRNPEVTSTLVEFQKKFEKGTTLGKFIIHYPEYFVSHVLNNLRILPNRFINSFHSTWNYSLILFVAIILLSVLLPILVLPNITILLFLISFAVQSLAMSLILQPMELYLVPFIVTITFLFMYIVNRIFYKLNLFNKSRMAISGVLIFGCLGLILLEKERFNFSSTNDHKVLQTLRHMDFKEGDYVIFHNLLPLLTNVKNMRTMVYIDTDIGITKDFGISDFFMKINLNVVCDSPYYDLLKKTKTFHISPILTNPEQFQFKLMNGSNSEVQCFRRENN